MSADFWSASALLGAARVVSNRDREAKRDRGEEGNPRADLFGAASELLHYRMISAFGSCQTPESSAVRQAATDGLAYMRDHLFVRGGGAGAGSDAPDFFTLDGGADGSIDAKSFDFMEKKAFFAINESKHNGLGRHRSQYFCMLCPPFASEAVVALVPYDEVDGWETNALGGDDPAKVLKIGSFVRQFIAADIRMTSLASPTPPHPREAVLASMSHAGLGRKMIGKVAGEALSYLQENGETGDQALNDVLSVANSDTLGRMA
ncbi:hypothetical protein ACS5PN_27225 [Roseateles sp. NT4]|uniref:hypothetical protein n=1 Tax=Roseateles sp. NT4 TaxID=3453715 RepID=UPI003EF04CCD